MTPFWKMITAVGVGAVAMAGAGALALTAMGGAPGGLGRADANGDGKVTRAEWLQNANARFVTLDANRDGMLVAAELPRRGGHRHRRHGGDRAWAPPAPQSGAQTAPPANATTPAN